MIDQEFTDEVNKQSVIKLKLTLEKLADAVELSSEEQIDILSTAYAQMLILCILGHDPVSMAVDAKKGYERIAEYSEEFEKEK
jgi:hypothetical protein